MSDMQLDLLGGETPHTEVMEQPTRCTRDKNCRAEADEHEDDCPVEHALLREFGF